MSSGVAASTDSVEPVPSEHTKDEVLAALTLKPGTGYDHADLIEYCRRRMAHFMMGPGS